MAALDFPASPSNGQQFTGPGGVIWVYDGAKWISGTLTTGIYAPITNDVGRNLVHNPLYNVQQRGQGAWTTTLNMTADRWQMQFQAGTMSTTIAPIAIAQAQTIGDEAATWALTANVTGGAGSSDYAILSQRLENVRSLGGKTVTVSFWAVANSGTPKIGVNLLQSFGTGGTAAIQGAGQGVTISTTWARYSMTFVIASVSGKTIAGPNDDYNRLTFWLSAGSAIGAPSGTTPVQTNIFSLWGVQLEIGTVATPLDKPDSRRDIANAQRFYQTAGAFLAGYALINNTIGLSVYLPVPLRSATGTTIALNNNTSSNTSALSTGVFTGAGAVTVYGIAVATGAWAINTYLTISADL